MLLTLWCTGLSAQVLIACDDQQGFGSSFCEQSCIYCDLNGFKDFTNSWPFPSPKTICKGGITLSNPRWYGFIAGSTTLILDVIPIKCTGGNGLVAAILDGCSNSIVCEPGAAGGAGTTLTLVAFGNLIPGNPYQLVVSGFNADFCDFELRVRTGSMSPPPMGPIGNIQGPTAICPKAQATYSVPPVDNAVSYTWTAPAGSKIDGTNSNTRVKTGSGANSINVKFGTLGGTICLTASNLCEAPQSKCITITNKALTATTLPKQTYCFEELPYEWGEAPNTTINFPGTYNLTSSAYTSYLGCDSIVKQTIVVKPRKQKTLPTTYICEGDCIFVGGAPFCTSGTYQELLSAADGCDSTVNFTVVRINNKAVVQKADTLTCSKTSVKLTSTGSTPRTPQVTYNWINSSSQTVGTTDTVTVSSTGIYSLIVISIGGGKTCRDTAKVTVVGSTAVPAANAGSPKVLSCDVSQVQLQGSGTTGPLITYLWTASDGGNIVTGSTTLTPTVNASGTYTLRVTNTSNGCTAESFVSVTGEYAPPTVSVQSGEFNCEATSFALNAITNAINPTYTWTGPNGFTSSLPSPLTNAAGVYTVVVTTSANGCTASATASVNANTSVPGATATGAGVTCADTSAVLGSTSTAPNSTFAWTGPNGFTSNVQNPTVTVPGVYTVKVTATNFCTATATASITQNTTAPGATLSVSGNLHCNAATVNLIVASTANPLKLNHVWTLPDNSTVITGAVAVLPATQPGNYRVVVTDSLNGCTSTAAIVVIQNPVVTATATVGQNIACFGANNGSASVVAAGGTGNFAYQWSNSAATAAVTGLIAGTYTVTVYDGNNCTTTASIVITQPTQLAANASATPQTSNGSADGSATAAPTGGTAPYGYQWSNNGTTATINNLLPGSYTVTVTDGNNCTSVQTVNVNSFNCTIQAAVNEQNVTCFGANNGTAAVTTTNATPPFNYLWSNNATTPSISGLAPGQYSVTVTDGSNCPSQLTFAITQPNALNVNATSTDASGPVASDGTASAGSTGGTPAYTYKWNTNATTPGITGLAAGVYTVTVTDANNCSATQTVTVSFINCTLATAFSNANPTCNGAANGEATVTVSSGATPFVYQWSNEATTPKITGLVAGTYTVTVTDANGCSITAETTLSQPAALSLSITATVNPDCPNSVNGSITAAATGGTGTLSYQWNNGQKDPTAINLAVGTYTVVITDANSCSTTQTATLTSVDATPPVIVNTVPATLPIGLSGTITVTLQNLNVQVTDNCTIATGGIVIVPTTFNCSQIGVRTVTVTATDASGNTSTSTYSVTVVDNLAPILGCPNSITRCAPDNTVTYQAPTVSDNCIFGGSFNQPSGLPSGAQFPIGLTVNTYSYTDASANVGTCSFEVTILAPVTVTVVNVVNEIGNQSNGSINIIVGGGLSPYTFQWKKNGVDIPGATSEDLTGIGIGSYTVVVTDNFGCTFTSPAIVIATSGTIEPEWAYGFSIRPNPTSGNLTVTFPQITPTDIQLFAYDLTGRMVVRQNWTPRQQLDLDFSELADGLYTVLIRVDGASLVRKIVVSK